VLILPIIELQSIYVIAIQNFYDRIHFHLLHKRVARKESVARESAPIRGYVNGSAGVIQQHSRFHEKYVDKISLVIRIRGYPIPADVVHGRDSQ